ncbi:uncharacterized protein H6S33_011428 [Morchella sextelata]|uniref:uncharacterized protein n=1 Tax=Morchella sextelata TaxID=1174677 RepID=UPI001D04D1D1|nr:uncharacterized protein H6S33_011428 [Morchella sextelata]KAH0611001.1 hypothetical protein H6S33_011428 [Morchella sextelata]
MSLEPRPSVRSASGYRRVSIHPDEGEMRSIDGVVHVHPRGEEDPDSDPDLRISRRVTEDFQRRCGNAIPPQWKPQNPEELQTHFSTMNRETQSHLARQHSAKKQFFHLLWKILLRWFATFVLSAGMLVTFYEFEKVMILDKSQKRWFNALSTGLYLTLGLNLAGSFKGMATIIRWKLLSRKSHSLEEVDFILGISSLIKVFRFGLHSLKGRPLRAFLCFLWLLINCIGRLSVALTGLTYSYDSADAFFSTPGQVAISDLSYFWPSNDTSEKPAPGAEYSTAHAWGLSSILLGNSEESHFGEFAHVLENHDGQWRYYFREYSPTNQAISHKSDRYITVSTTCNYFPVIKGQNGTTDSITYRNGTEEIELKDVGYHSRGVTTWLNLRSDLLGNAEWYCGPRCAAMAAIQYLPYDPNLDADIEKRDDDDEDDQNSDSNEYGSYFSCTIDISEVHNAKIPEHHLPDRMAVIAAGAIGSQGYANGYNTSWASVGYYEGTMWGERVEGDAERMAELGGQFACGVIASRDQFGSSTIKAQGNKPAIGVLLKIKWPETIAILGGILLAQLIMGLMVILWSTTVICKADSYLATARLLRPIVERLGPNGCYLTGQEISSTFEGRVVYGVRVDPSGTRHHLDIGEDITVKKHFPEGWYDGEEDSMYPKSSTSCQETKSLERAGIVRDKTSTPRLRRRRIIKKTRRGTVFV